MFRKLKIEEVNEFVDAGAVDREVKRMACLFHPASRLGAIKTLAESLPENLNGRTTMLAAAELGVTHISMRAYLDGIEEVDRDAV